MESTAWSPLGGTVRLDHKGDRPAPASAPLMTLSITAYGTTPEDVAITAQLLPHSGRIGGIR